MSPLPFAAAMDSLGTPRPRAHSLWVLVLGGALLVSACTSGATSAATSSASPTSAGAGLALQQESVDVVKNVNPPSRSRGSSDEVRARLERRIERPEAQYEWGDDAEYRAKMLETRAELALMPEPEKVVTFDAVAALVSSPRVAIDAATPEQLKELIGMLVAPAKATAAGAYEIAFVPAARPFFAPRESLLLAPPDGRRGAGSKALDPLAWYATDRRRMDPAVPAGRLRSGGTG